MIRVLLALVAVAVLAATFLYLGSPAEHQRWTERVYAPQN